MTSKMGRPPAENPKSNPIHVRLDSHEIEVLDKYCKKYNIKRTEGIRDGIKMLEAHIEK